MVRSFLTHLRRWRWGYLLALGGLVWVFHSRLSLVEPDRVAQARAERGAEVRRLCAQAGLAYPPRELYLRAFKSEGVLECWARDGDTPYRLVRTFPITQRSGELGPKRREGDFQVPEGFYHIAVFNPLSSFHLSLGLDYPNASDARRSDPTQPGSDIYIHGGEVSIGCLPLGDDPIEELYLLAADTARHGRPIPVHLFPARMRGPQWEALAAAHPQHAAFWAELRPAYEAFEKTHLVPTIEVDGVGRYVVR